MHEELLPASVIQEPCENQINESDRALVQCPLQCKAKNYFSKTKFSRLKIPNIKFLDKPHKHRAKLKNNALNLKLWFIVYIEYKTFIGNEDSKQFLFVIQLLNNYTREDTTWQHVSLKKQKANNRQRAALLRVQREIGEGRRRGGRGGKLGLVSKIKKIFFKKYCFKKLLKKLGSLRGKINN